MRRLCLHCETSILGSSGCARTYHAYLQACLLVHTYTHRGTLSLTHARTHKRAHTHTHTHTRRHMHTHRHRYRYTYAHTTHTRRHRQTHTYTHMHTHTHTQVVYAGLRQQRHELADSPEYQRWHMNSKLKTPHLTSVPPLDLDASSPNASSEDSTDLLLGQRLHELSLAATGSSSSSNSGTSGKGEKSRAASFLAAVDAVFLNLRFDALESHRNFPYHFATYQIGHQVCGKQVRRLYVACTCLREGEGTRVGVWAAHTCFFRELPESSYAKER